MLKVALLAPYPRDENFTRGGVEKVTHGLVEGLRLRDDLELHVVALSDVSRPAEKRVGRVFVHYLPRQRKFCLPTFSALSVARARSKIRSLRPDLVHCQESGLESFIAAGIDIPSVVTIHAIFRNEAPHYPGLKAKARYTQIAWMHAWAEKRIRHYVPSSAYAEAELSHLGSKLLPVIENPVDPRWFEVPEGCLPGRLLFAGTMYPRKGVLDLVRAAGRLRRRGVPFTLHMTGEVRDPDYFAQVRAAAQEEGIAEAVEFRGLVTEDEMAREFREAAIVVLPSYAETSPMVIGQAMAAARPVVGTTVGGVPYLVEHGVNGLLGTPGDIEGLAQRLADILTDDDVRQRMARSAREKAVARFSAPEVAAQAMAVYRTVLGR